MTSAYRLHGATIVSEIALPEPSELVAGPPDITIGRGSPLDIPLLEPNVAQLRHVQGNALRYEGRECDGTWTLQIPGLVRFVLEGKHVTGHAAHEAAPGTLELLLAGTGLSFAFTVLGDLVLHASAVTTDEGCIAFVGDSGQGKTTLAALAANAGYGFFADDVLRVRFADDIRAHRGATEARLRTSPADLGIDVTSTRTTIDDRYAVALPRSTEPSATLAALVVPRLRREARGLAVRRLGSEEAFTVLLGAPRILGWTHRRVLEHQFQAIARLAEEVPVLEADLPWGIPPAATLAGELIEQVRTRVEKSSNAR